jgi:hypothetical protein
MISVQIIYRVLGYAGLIPFVIPAYLVVAGSAHADLSVAIAGAYAFGILREPTLLESSAFSPAAGGVWL